MPVKMRAVATHFPALVMGTVSPQPTMAAVTTAHHSASETLWIPPGPGTMSLEEAFRYQHFERPTVFTKTQRALQGIAPRS
jgi:hypothetical protein